MQQLTGEGRRIVDGVAQRHGFSSDAVLTMLLAVSAGYGNQAQFSHPEFGGMGQWSSGGMVMIGDMFNNYLKGRVSSLCQELSTLIQGQPLFAIPAQAQSQSQGGGWQGQGGNWQGQLGGNSQQQSSGGSGFNSGMGTSLFVQGSGSGNWWPSDLGAAGSTGSQNNLRYAYFPNARRLAIDQGGQVTVYDTGDHQIGGFGQQQSGDQSITFTSQYGVVRVADLPQITGNNNQNAPSSSFPQNNPAPAPQQANTWTPSPAVSEPLPASPSPATPQPHVSSNEIFSLLEKLADLHTKGILTDAEYETKKVEMLKRL
jgi:hypothetical protein